MRRALVSTAFLSTALVAMVAFGGGVGALSAQGHAPRIAGATNSDSTNWSGYAVTGSTPFTDVQGSWTQPSASCSSSTASPSEAPTAKDSSGNGHGQGGGHGQGSGSGKVQSSYSSFWVGLDGYSSSTVEQVGTDADCVGTTPTYYAWYELYPAFPINLSTVSNPVSVGDALSAEVSVDTGSDSVTIRISDAGKWDFSTSVPDRNYTLSSAEWIAEAPSSGKVLPLANFGSVAFTNARATGGGSTGTISDFNDDPITMVTKTGQTKAAPSELTAGGSSFTVTWSHS
jgi:Peptidase A4 family